MATASKNNQRIFAVPPTLAQRLAIHQTQRAEQQRLHPDRPHFYRDSSDVYRVLYAEALKRLSQNDMLPLDQAAAKMNLTPAALIRKADRGQIVLIALEDVKVVPHWMLDSSGRVKQFHNAIAREFAQSEKSDFFEFMGYLKFMGDDELKLRVDNLSPRSVKEIFRATGVTQGACSAHVRTPMFEAADGACRTSKNARGKSHLVAAFIDALGSAVTRIGGLGNPNEGGLSSGFLNKYVPQDIPNRDRWQRDLEP